MRRASTSFSSRLYRRISSSSCATERRDLPSTRVSYSSCETTGVGQRRGLIAESSEVCQNGPASLMYIHASRLWRHLQRSAQQRGRSLNRRIPSMSNSQDPYLTGNGTVLPFEFLRARFAIPSVVKSDQARSRGSSLIQWLKS